MTTCSRNRTRACEMRLLFGRYFSSFWAEIITKSLKDDRSVMELFCDTLCFCLVLLWICEHRHTFWHLPIKHVIHFRPQRSTSLIRTSVTNLFHFFIQVPVSPQLVVNSVWTCDGVMAFAHIISVFIFIRVFFCRYVTMQTVWIATRNNLSCCVTTVTSAFTVATTWARTCVSTSSKKVNNF